ncbi:MAG: cytochrome P450 [Deltaproteobacteria bacterium]|nr:cytochrome P450 [Deltaproteobacteria bacterium]MCB9788587.1 cytochrome P450 [Deltaproteobacteria bacterium]
MAVLLMLRRAHRALRGTYLDHLPGSDAPGELVHLLRDPFRFLHERFERHGNVFRTRLALPVVFLVGEEANRTVMLTRRDAFAMGRGYHLTAVRRVFEGSIMLEDGEQHARTRAVLTPAVGHLALRESSDRVHAIWSRMLDGVDRVGGEDCYGLAERGTFDVAANALTGLDLGRETESFRPRFERLIDGIMAPTPYRVPLGRLDRAMGARAELMRLLRPRVEAARRAEPSGLVGQLAHARDADGQPLETDAIIGQLLLLFWAGYDTTASAGAWVLHVLARRPDWQQRLRDEVRDRLGTEPVGPDDARALPQLGCFLSEIERMYPSALFFPRVTEEDVSLLGHTLPRDTPVFYSPYLSHRDPEAFDHPNAFDPDRWDSERSPKRARTALLVGFGSGPRVCLGKAFAKLQLRILVAEALRRYRLEPDPGARFTVQGLPVHHPNGSRVRFRPL